MSAYLYEAVDPGGLKIQGTIEVADQSEALRRIKEMGLFPTKIAEARERRRRVAIARAAEARRRRFELPLVGGRVKPRVLAVFTRQLATLLDAGMPLLRGLRTLREQEENPTLRRILDELGASIEGGSSLSEALMSHPRVFSPLFVNMVRAGEMAGALELTLQRLAQFSEKAQKIKGKIKAAMFYPCAVLVVATAILILMMVFVVPRFQEVFVGLVGNAGMPPFTQFVLSISVAVKNHIVAAAAVVAAMTVIFLIAIRTVPGRRALDRAKLTVPVFGPVFRKLAISRFTRTLGTLLNSGVPILQALTIVRETSGNVIVGDVVSDVHDRVKEGDTMAAQLKASRIFPAMVAGMVDIGEQTGSLPDMLMKIADNYDDEVDNAVSAMTSLLEPIMIVFLAVVVGSIVIAMFLPIIHILNFDTNGNRGDM